MKSARIWIMSLAAFVLVAGMVFGRFYANDEESQVKEVFGANSESLSKEVVEANLTEIRSELLTADKEVDSEPMDDHIAKGNAINRRGEVEKRYAEAVRLAQWVSRRNGFALEANLLRLPDYAVER